jgi:hypothetical protein
MAELVPKQRDILLRASLLEYNAKRSTHFSLDHLLDKSNDASCDYHLIDPNGRELKIQLTTPPGDSNDRRLCSSESKFLRALRTAIAKSDIRGGAIILSYVILPRGERQRQDLISELVRVVSLVRALPKSPSGIVLSQQDLREYAESLGKHFFYLKIIDMAKRDAQTVVLMGSYLGSLVPDPAMQIKESYFKKLNRYRSSAGDLVLLVYFDVSLCDADEVGSMISALSQFFDEFREVWVLCNVFSSSPRIDCIWPGESG